MKRIIYFLLLLVSLAARAQDVLKVQGGASLTVQAGATLTLQGGAVLDNGSTLSNNGTITLKGGTSGQANWTDQTLSGYNHGGGSFLFNAVAPQTLSTNNILGALTVDNPAGLTLATSVRAGIWTLKSGVVNTGANYAHVYGTSSSALRADPSNPEFSNSWFNGTLRRFLSPATENRYEFPVGNATRLNRLALDNLSADPLTGISFVDVSFTPKPGSDAGLMASELGTTYVRVNTGGVWLLRPDASPTGGKYDLQLYINGFTGLADNRFAILRRPDASANAAEWQVPSGSSLPPANSPGRRVSDGYARRTNLSGFSQLGIAESDISLPVHLTDFTVVRSDKARVQVSWNTLTEQNCLGFDIERRLENETSFRPVGYLPTRATNGNSSGRLGYSFTDANGYAGISYYRVQQKDRDGRSFYTLIRAVSGMDGGGISILIWPNPGKGQFSIRMDGVSGTKQGRIIDAGGKTVRQFTVSGREDRTISGLAAGMYTVLISDAFGPGRHFSEKLWVVGN